MKVQSVYLFFFLALSIVSSYGCSILPRVSVEQAWSENYAFASGTQANDPAIIDGNPETIGQSQYVEGSADVVRDHSAPSEAVVILPEPKPIHRVVI
ncbi:MAG: hypothetical protein O7E52_21835 [Candidatus Poribacteria bacterium]|nr:hypothetical protein [Candidatus Poribacteria bacterium]